MLTGVWIAGLIATVLCVGFAGLLALRDKDKALPADERNVLALLLAGLLIFLAVAAVAIVDAKVADAP